MSVQQFWADGQCVSELPMPCRAAEFGDGLFETLRIAKGRALLLSYHLDRLQQGADKLMLSVSRDEVLSQLEQALAAFDASDGALRITCARASSGRGYGFDPGLKAQLWFSFTPTQDDWQCLPAPARIAVAEQRLGYFPRLAGIKHLNRLEQVLASAEARQRGVDELLMCDYRGRPLSMIAANVFLWMPEGYWLTPKLSHTGIAGTVRRLLLSADITTATIVEKAVSWEDVAQATELFYCNSLWGLRPVGEWGDRRWLTWPNTSQLFDEYRERAVQC